MTDRLCKSEVFIALALLVLHIFLIPLLILGGSMFWGWDFWGLNDTWLNFIYYSVDAVLALCFLGKYLRRSFDSLLDRPLKALETLLIGWAIYYVLSFALGTLLGGAGLSAADNPNQNGIGTMKDADFGAIAAMSIFIAPIVEETLFRGGLFCGLYHKNRFLAYAVTVILFGLYHVWQYAVFVDVRFLIFALQYVPAGIVLCWCYERSGSVWTSIAFHMVMNAVGVFLL